MHYVSFPLPLVLSAHDHKRHAADVIGSRQTTRTLTPRIQLCPSAPAIPFKQRRRRYPMKILFAVTISEDQGQTFIRVGIYTPSAVFSPWPSLCCIFLILFIWLRRCCNYWRVSTVYRRSLNFRYINQSLLIKYFIVPVHIICMGTTNTAEHPMYVQPGRYT
jgi:hypothetical protein